MNELHTIMFKAHLYTYLFLNQGTYILITYDIIEPFI